MNDHKTNKVQNINKVSVNNSIQHFIKRNLKSYLPVFLFLLNAITLPAQSIQDLSFGTDTTLEVMTWNIQNFPKNGETTTNNVSQIIINLDVDLLALQEIEDTNVFKQMVNDLSGYEADFRPSYMANLAYIYKTDEIQIDDIYEIYTAQSYSGIFPRSPLVMEFTFKNREYIAINNHFKCCGDGILDLDDYNDEETKRYHASNYLKDYIDNNFPEENVIMLGDLNDELTDETQNNVFQQILDDPDNYSFADMEIANASSSEWSYPTWPSHLDHILITNELFNEFEKDISDIQCIKLDDYFTNGWNEYESKVSDHRPVALKLSYQSTPTPIDKINSSDILLSNYPNPFKNSTTLHFSELNEKGQIEIFTMEGRKVQSISLSAGQSSTVWNAENLPAGVYIARLILNGKKESVSQMLLKE